MKAHLSIPWQKILHFAFKFIQEEVEIKRKHSEFALNKTTFKDILFISSFPLKTSCGFLSFARNKFHRNRETITLVCRQLLFMVHDLLLVEGKIAATKRGGKSYRKVDIGIRLFDGVYVDVARVKEWVLVNRYFVSLDCIRFN